MTIREEEMHNTKNSRYCGKEYQYSVRKFFGRRQNSPYIQSYKGIPDNSKNKKKRQKTQFLCYQI